LCHDCWAIEKQTGQLQGSQRGPSSRHAPLLLALRWFGNRKRPEFSHSVTKLPVNSSLSPSNIA
jgi:hypothetical protein